MIRIRRFLPEYGGTIPAPTDEQLRSTLDRLRKQLQTANGEWADDLEMRIKMTEQQLASREHAEPGATCDLDPAFAALLEDWKRTAVRPFLPTPEESPNPHQHTSRDGQCLACRWNSEYEIDACTRCDHLHEAGERCPGQAER